MLRPLDRDALRAQFRAAKPFPHIVIEDLLTPSAVLELAASYPDFATARTMGFEFSAVNEQKKVQICDSARFPATVRRFSDAISSPQFLADLEYITGIPRLLADPQFDGGGMHVTGPGGRLDVHVDFNYLEPRQLYRRLNLLLYLNEGWKPEWGGQIELWDREVKTCHVSRLPVSNMCLIFETSHISYHGVRPVTSPPDVPRRSFAAYYYTREAPEGWAGQAHSTIFRARPDERFRGVVMMPLESMRRRVRQGVETTKRILKTFLSGPR